MQVTSEHDNREGEDVGSVSTCKDSLLGIAAAVAGWRHVLRLLGLDQVLRGR